MGDDDALVNRFKQRLAAGEVQYGLFSGLADTVATEVLGATPAIRNLIREGKTHQIYSAMQAGSQHGMHTMDQSLRLLPPQWQTESWLGVHVPGLGVVLTVFSFVAVGLYTLRAKTN